MDNATYQSTKADYKDRLSVLINSLSDNQRVQINHLLDMLCMKRKIFFSLTDLPAYRDALKELVNELMNGMTCSM
jgi:hypothetical protein